MPTQSPHDGGRRSALAHREGVNGIQRDKTNVTNKTRREQRDDVRRPIRDETKNAGPEDKNKKPSQSALMRCRCSIETAVGH